MCVARNDTQYHWKNSFWHPSSIAPVWVSSSIYNTRYLPSLNFYFWSLACFEGGFHITWCWAPHVRQHIVLGDTCQMVFLFLLYPRSVAFSSPVALFQHITSGAQHDWGGGGGWRGWEGAPCHPWKAQIREKQESSHATYVVHVHLLTDIWGLAPKISLKQT